MKSVLKRISVPFFTITKVVGLVWRTNGWQSFSMILLSVLQGIIPAAQLWVTKLMIDTAVVLADARATDKRAVALSLITLIIAQAGIYIVHVLLAMGQDTIRALLGEALSNRLNIQILTKTNSLELSFFENEQFYNKLQVAYQEAGSRPIQIVTQLVAVVQSTLTLISMVVLLIRLHWLILPLLALSVIPMLVVQNRYGVQNYFLQRARAPELRKQSYFGLVLTSAWFIKEIRIFHLEDYFLDLFKSLFAKFFKENKALLIKRNVHTVLASLVTLLGWLVAGVYVIFRTVMNTLSIGDFALYIQAISYSQGQIQSLISGISSIYSDQLFIQNLFDFLSLPAKNLSAGKRWTEPIREIEFRNVSFAYPNSGNNALNKVSFVMRCGQPFAIVGKNGAGKTTLVKLLCRLYAPTSGEILFNGKDISRYSARSIQEHISALFQDFGQYHLTARENIGLGRVKEINNINEIKEAAKRSRIYEKIEGLPDKFETYLGKAFNEGMELSGGEWQKIALARGLFRKGGVLILDEPTAALDSEAEHEVFKDLIENCSDHITLLISHRFSTVRYASKILLLENGCFKELGTHEELVKLKGQYAHLFQLQASGYLDDDHGYISQGINPPID